MSELIRLFTGQGDQSSRELERALQRVTDETRLEGHKIDAQAALVGKITQRETEVTMAMMDSVREVDAYRKLVANGDEILNVALADIEMEHIARLRRMRGLR